MKRNGTGVALGMILAFAGIILVNNYTLIGVLLIFAGAGITAGTMMIQKPRAEVSHDMKVAQPQMMIETPEQRQQAMMDLVSDPHPPMGRVKGEVSVLIRTLRQAQLDPHIPVLEDDGGPLLFVQDVLEEMVTQAKRYNKPVSDLAENAVKLYDRVFENTPAACQAEHTVPAVCIWLANRCLKDIFPALDKPEIKPANKPSNNSKPSRFEL